MKFHPTTLDGMLIVEPGPLSEIKLVRCLAGRVLHISAGLAHNFRHLGSARKIYYRIFNYAKTSCIMKFVANCDKEKSS